MGGGGRRGKLRTGNEPRDDRGIGDRLRGVLAVELIAVGIALASPVTPTRTGSRWSPAELFVPDPSYLQKVVAAFAVVHLLFLLLGGVVFVVHLARGGTK